MYRPAGCQPRETASLPPHTPANVVSSPAPAARPVSPAKSSSIEVDFLKAVFAEIVGVQAAEPRRDDTTENER